MDPGSTSTSSQHWQKRRRRRRRRPAYSGAPKVSAGITPRPAGKWSHHHLTHTHTNVGVRYYTQTQVVRADAAGLKNCFELDACGILYFLIWSLRTSFVLRNGERNDNVEFFFFFLLLLCSPKRQPGTSQYTLNSERDPPVWVRAACELSAGLANRMRCNAYTDMAMISGRKNKTKWWKTSCRK